MPKKKSSYKNKINPVIVTSMKAYLQFLETAVAPSPKISNTVSEKIGSSEAGSFKKFYEVDSEQAYVERLKNDVKATVVPKMTSEMFAEKMSEKLSGELLLYVTFGFFDIISQITYRKSLKTLYKEAKTGDQQSLFKLLRLDKTLFDHEWVRELMRKEMHAGNIDFFKKIGNAIKCDPPVGKLRQGKLKFILRTYWQLGLDQLSIPELVELLEDCGLELKPALGTLDQLVRREIKPLFKTS